MQCIFEDGVSAVTKAHIKAAATQNPLPDRYAYAEASRAKVIELDAVVEEAQAQEPTENVESLAGLVEDVISRLQSASRFSYEDDRHIAQAMLLDFDWLINAAMAQARLDPMESTTMPSHVRKRLLHDGAHTKKPHKTSTSVTGVHLRSRRSLLQPVDDPAIDLVSFYRGAVTEVANSSVSSSTCSGSVARSGCSRIHCESGCQTDGSYNL